MINFFALLIGQLVRERDAVQAAADQLQAALNAERELTKDLWLKLGTAEATIDQQRKRIAELQRHLDKLTRPPPFPR